MKKIYLYNFFSGLLFFMPLLIPIYHEKSIDSTTIFIIEAIFYLVVFLFEIPSGYLGDYWGHKVLASIGMIGVAISYLVFFLASSLPLIILSQLMMVICTTLISGSDETFFYEVLETTYSADDIYHIQRQNYYYFTLGSVISFVLGAAITQIGLDIIFLLPMTACSYFFAFLTFISLKVPKGINHKAQSTRFEISHLKKHSSTVLMSGILLGLLSNFYWIIQLFYQRLALSDLTIGILFATSAILTLLYSRWSNPEKTSKIQQLLLAFFPVCYFLTLFNQITIIPIVLLIYSVVKIEIIPFTNNLILRHASENRALLLSTASWLNNFIQVVLLLLFYSMMRVFDYYVTIICLSLLILLLLLIAWKISGSKT